MTPEMPLMAEWVRSGSVGGPSPDVSIGLSLEIAKPASVHLPPARSSRSQLATLHYPASLNAGPSIGQVFRQQRSSSEGAPLAWHSRETAPPMRPRSILDPVARPASSAVMPSGAGHRQSLHNNNPHSIMPQGNDPEGSTTAISQANAVPFTSHGTHPTLTHPVNLTPAKPTDSLSSAAPDGVTGRSRPDDEHQQEFLRNRVDAERPPAPATSLTSHHAGAVDVEHQEHPAETVTLVSNFAGGCNASHNGGVAPQTSGGTLPAPSPGGHSGLTQHQLQSVVSAALARVPIAGARPGESSNSGNLSFLKIVGIKRKAVSGRPPMAPPAQIPRYVGGLAVAASPAGVLGVSMVAQPSVSGLGLGTQTEAGFAVEDAVSMVEHGLEADVHEACDAVSKASEGDDEAGVGDTNDNDTEAAG